MRWRHLAQIVIIGNSSTTVDAVTVIDFATIGMKFDAHKLWAVASGYCL